MKLSTKGRYGLRVMFDLALNYSDTPVSLTDVSERQKISLSYLEQLMILLKKSGLVRSVRGAQGGYVLAKYPNAISVGDVLRAMEGSLAPTQCIEAVNGDIDCVPRLVYSKIYEGILDVVDNLTLQDMKEEFYSDYLVDEIVDLTKTKIQ
ncbi:MAG: Rrf2 family transcriptional regulator [Bacillota bacterium]|nr:Rrf2 family transcriptional regulator [Bacillota bacterium]